MWMVLLACAVSAVAWTASLKTERLIRVREEQYQPSDLEQFDRLS
ncbi:hypothetical protein Dform_00460 [Dehalogenimonas formicexedens]|uniref:Uncharacterized protein n=1 Tax=Dehalogenimonas formicexedens TaxID=1839801 RepID=A0A1P8F5Q3_9CHLR|nr:hypothetical protein [Dehalogenimonas formicexedens]APV43816.1 hypothetical protein Dform_00460 [Dehalogenimonas formicexedens]